MVANLTTRLGQLTSSPAGGPYAGANKIINGDMRIDQRNVGATVVPSATTVFVYTIDRFAINNSNASKITYGQDYGGVTPPAGFKHYLGSKITTAHTLGSNDYSIIAQKIEGQNCLDLGWGAAGAKSITLSFWVYASATGTYGGVIANSAQDRNYPFTYIINSANTWEYKTITIPGDTTGTWLTTSGIGLSVFWSLGSGSTYSGADGAWASGVIVTATGAKDITGTLNGTLYITGVKLEVGSIATPFVPDDYQVSLGKCQRYFETSYDTGTAINTATGSGAVGNQSSSGALTTAYLVIGIQFKVTKRAIPTVTSYDIAGGGAGTIARTNPGVANYNGNSATVAGQGQNGCIAYSASGTSSASVICHYTADAEL